MNCPNCGAPVANGSQFCNNCGTPVAQRPPQPQPQQQYQQPNPQYQQPQYQQPQPGMQYPPQNGYPYPYPPKQPIKLALDPSVKAIVPGIKNLLANGLLFYMIAAVLSFTQIFCWFMDSFGYSMYGSSQYMSMGTMIAGRGEVVISVFAIIFYICAIATSLLPLLNKRLVMVSIASIAIEAISVVFYIVYWIVLSSQSFGMVGPCFTYFVALLVGAAALACNILGFLKAKRAGQYR